MRDGERVRTAPLGGDVDVDVAVVGAGLTGLWTAYYLVVADPSLRIAVLERHQVGFGASGRNGGWCSALLPNSLRTLERRHGHARTVAMQRVMHGAVDEVARVLAEEGGGADLAKGGSVTVARTAEQAARLADELAEARAFGLDEGDLRRLTMDELAARCRMSRARAALYTPHCAALHPLRLVHALARSVQRRGVAVHEHTALVDWSPGRVVTDARTRQRIEGGAGDGGLHGSAARSPSRPRAALLTDGRDRAIDRRAVGAGRAGRPRDVPRWPPPDHLRPAHGRRPAGLRRSRRAVPLRVADRGPASTPTGRCGRCSSRRCASCSPSCVTSRSRTTGEVRSACRGTGSGRRASTAPPASPRQAATWATAWPPRTSPGERWPT